jgi:hypothetical protein
MTDRPLAGQAAFVTGGARGNGGAHVKLAVTHNSPGDG